VDPYDKEEAVKKSEAEFSKIKIRPIPARVVRLHLQDASPGRAELVSHHRRAHKKLLLAGLPISTPVKAFHNEMLRWYDQWLKGIDTESSAIRRAILGDGRQ